MKVPSIEQQRLDEAHGKQRYRKCGDVGVYGSENDFPVVALAPTHRLASRIYCCIERAPLGSPHGRLPAARRGNHPSDEREAVMNEDVFNNSLRKFLKKVGVTSQREMEKAVREAVASGRLKGHEKLSAKMVLTLDGINLTHEVDEEIELG